jgi:hypothetical protein
MADMPPVRAIITSGFSYSGSSAVLDFLRGDPRIANFPGGEFRFFRARWGMNTLIKTIRRSGDIPEEQLNNFLRFCRREMPVESRRDATCNRFVKRVKSAIPEIFKDTIRSFAGNVAIAKSYEDPVVKVKLLKKAVKQFTATFVRDYSVTTGSEAVLLDQAVRPWTLGQRKYIPGRKIVMVTRDPRDQYVDQYMKAGTPVREVQQFMAALEARLQTAIQTASTVGAEEFMLIRFEDFVSEFESVSDKIYRFIGLDAPETKNTKYFDPSVSIKNIGIYKSFEHQNEITLIERKYSHLIYEAAKPRFISE